MNKEVKQQEIWNGLDISYSYTLINGGVSEVSVNAIKSIDGAYTKVERNYWRDNSFAPTMSESSLTYEENQHILEVVNSIWGNYPDINFKLED